MKDIAKKLKLGLAGIVLAFNAKSYAANQNITTYTPNNSNNQKEISIIYGNSYSCRKTKSSEKTLDFSITPLENRKTTEYIPTKIYTPDGRSINQMKIQNMDFRISNLIKYRKIHSNNSNIDQKSISPKIPKIKILDKKYIIIQSQAENQNNLPFYLVPVENTKIKTDTDTGNTSITGEIYRPKIKESSKSNNVTFHKVKKDENLTKIAKKYNTTVENIIESNFNLTDKNKDKIYPGQEVIIK